MVKNNDFVVELLCIEPEDIKNEKSLSKALSYSDTLWKSKEPKENSKKYISLVQDELDIKINIFPLDTSKMFTDYIETAFILQVISKSFDELEEFRLALLRHLKAKLKFSHIRVLQDDISTYIANQLYPKVNELESLLRKYLIKFFIQRVGVDWWEVSANEKMLSKVKIRRKDRKDEFANYIETDIEYADFDDLGTLIYKQSSGFNQPEKALEYILTISDLEKLEEFKTELKGNYIKYFKENFRDKNFEGLWKDLFKIRNKVAHQGNFYKQDLEKGLKLYKELVDIIEVAESKIDELVLSVQEKEAIRQATIDALTEEEPPKIILDETVSENSDTNIKIVGKIDLPTISKRTFKGYRVITEEELYDELEQAKDIQYNQFIGLKWFVTQYLAEKNYSIGFSYSLINILSDKGKVELYDIPAYGGYDIKAIKKTDSE